MGGAVRCFANLKRKASASYLGGIGADAFLVSGNRGCLWTFGYLAEFSDLKHRVP